MQCPRCKHQTSRVVDSRPHDEGESIRRRRECLECGFRFNTFERVEKAPLLVIKRDGSREEFNSDKLLRGIVRSAEKRPVSLEDMQNLVTEVERTIRERGDGEVQSAEIGELVMPLLLELDEVAYIRFASVYREFHSKEMFLKELEAIENKNKEQDTDDAEV